MGTIPDQTLEITNLFRIIEIPDLEYIPMDSPHTAFQFVTNAVSKITPVFCVSSEYNYYGC